MPHTRPVAVALALALGGTGLAGCGSSTPPEIAASARVEQVPGSPAGRIVLTAAGAERIGLKTARVRRAGAKGGAGRAAPATVIPFSAIVSAPNGRTYAFRTLAPLVYGEVRVRVDHVTGGAAYLSEGPPAGTHVVSVGAEELFGVQTGVLDQT
jgi:hypothetical protein